MSISLKQSILDFSFSFSPFKNDTLWTKGQIIVETQIHDLEKIFCKDGVVIETGVYVYVVGGRRKQK